MTTRPLPRPPASDPPAVRLRDPEGVVAAVPYLLGFAPRRSLVVVGLQPDRSVGPTMRCDWEPGHRTSAPLWRHLGGVARRNGCTSVLVVVYVEADPHELAPGWDDELLAAVLGGSVDPDRTDPLDGPDGLYPLDVLDVLVVGPRRFRSLLCLDATCCPAQGSAVSPTRAHPVAAEFVLAGRSPARDRAHLQPEDVVDDADRAVALAAARETRPSRDATTDPTGAEQAGARDRALLRRWTASLPEGPDPVLAGQLVAAWSRRPRLRDACLATLLPGGEQDAAAVLAPAGTEAAGRLRDVLADPRCVDATRVGTPVLRRLAALSEGHDRAGVLAAHAWLCWAAGEGVAAGVLAERAVVEHPGQSLARLVLQCLRHGLGAPWTSRERW